MTMTSQFLTWSHHQFFWLCFFSLVKFSYWSKFHVNIITGPGVMTRREVSYLINYDTLLQNATDIITKCDSYFITKYDRSLLQNASGFLLQNGTVITNCDSTLTTKFFFKFIIFWPILSHFPNFWGKKKFFQKIWLCQAKLDKGF